MDRTADQVVRYLVEHGRCTDCGGRYNAEDVYVLDQHGHRVFDLAAVCCECYTLSFIRAVVGPKRDDVAGRPTALTGESVGRGELTPAEKQRFDSLPPVQKADVVEVSTFLSKFDGDFHTLFGREADER
jgi:hypothetical protein